MAISPELMYAILAMDSYNRGYNPGIEGLGGASSSIGDTIGNATVTSEDRSSDAQTAGFYAVAYQWNGETIVAYRGKEGCAGWKNWKIQFSRIQPINDLP